jgi:hypothetical protein
MGDSIPNCKMRAISNYSLTDNPHSAHNDFSYIFTVQFSIIVYNSTAILLVIISLINKIYRPDANATK